jgi:16S rRNA (uracil1498-N3)-methyltransferase
MKIHRFITKFNPLAQKVSIEDIALVHQIKNVLKLKVGELIDILDGSGTEGRAKIEKITASAIEVLIIETKKEIRAEQVEIILCCSILKKENFEWVVEKATELGVSKIIPLICAKTVKLKVDIGRLERIAKEATEQSGQNRVPEIGDIMTFSDLMQSKPGQIFFFDRTGTKVTTNTFMQFSGNSVVLCIGPEGGWAENELELAQKNGAHIVSLGQTTLRGETAALAAVCAVKFLN